MPPTKFRNVDMNNFLDDETLDKILDCIVDVFSERYGCPIDRASLKLMADIDVHWDI